MRSMRLIQKAAWISLGASLAVFAVGVWLVKHFLCQSHGPNAFGLSLLFCAVSFAMFATYAFQRRSVVIASGALAVALLGAALLFASIGLALPGCSGV
jgi:hypothetical protein